ncbi:MAG: endonuclease/exonuclease/phosphatase family protein [Microscillaceae bacterium]|jgi:endonuclease/exonuclease/phosphatase family metal-dependent hydrolase|nr:endonuclease/exonuclease/phosphatase family protein [Microscillaceae bacterium]
MLKLFKWILVILMLLILAFAGLVYFGTYQPEALQNEPIVSPSDAPILSAKQKIKVLSWNVQYMAGKNYVFFYDLLDGSGPDERPSRADIDKTTEAVARLIYQENPDIILLQELDEGSKRTDYEDQLQKLLTLLPQEYSSHTSAFYWKVWFVPHPRIMGKGGMKLSVISKYKIQKSVRHQLAQIEQKVWYNWLMKQFNFKRAIQEVSLPLSNGKELLVFNTHLDAFAQGTNTMQRQVAYTKKLLAEKTRQNIPWLIGGDFNLLPPGKSYSLLSPDIQKYYQPVSEISPLFTDYQAVPSAAETEGAEREKWFTHFPNNPKIKQPDRTIDYIFLSKKVKLGNHYIRQQSTLTISDHLPVVVEFELDE